MSFFATILLVIGASQTYWGWRGVRLARRKIASPVLRGWVCAAIPVLLVGMFLYNLGGMMRRPDPVHLTLRAALVTAAFAWWLASSMV